MKTLTMPDISRFKKETKLAKYAFQDYVLKVIKDFGIIHPYDKQIWKWSKKNLSFLKGRVENLREQALYKKEKLNTYGRLLIWCLQKKESQEKNSSKNSEKCTVKDSGKN